MVGNLQVHMVNVDVFTTTAALLSEQTIAVEENVSEQS